METINQAFSKLLEANTIGEVREILDHLEIDKKFRMPENAYPEIKFRIEKQEIEALIESKIIGKDYSLNPNFEENSLSNLLYAVLWKNGDLPKIRHIIEGILEESEENRDNGLVFYQFGRYLTKKDGEPIIDQHVLRAFGIYKAEGNEDKIKKLKKLSLITKNEKILIQDYKKWLKTELNETLRSDKNYSYEVDKVLFAIGKSMKSK